MDKICTLKHLCISICVHGEKPLSKMFLEWRIRSTGDSGSNGFCGLGLDGPQPPARSLKSFGVTGVAYNLS